MSSLEEGKDVQLLRAIFSNTIEKISEGVSVDRFVELFSGFWSKSKAKKLYAALQSQLTSDMKELVNELIEDEKLDSKFTLRAELLQKQKEFDGTTAWRPTGDPTRDQRSHDMQVLIRMKTAMEEYMNQKQPEIDRLLEEVRLGRHEAQRHQAIVENMSRKIVEQNNRLDEYEDDYSRILRTLAPSTHENEEN